MQKRIWAMVLMTLGLVAAMATVGIGSQQSDGRVFVVSYVEVAPASDAQALALLKTYRDAGRRGEGNMRLEILQQEGRAGHFVVVEEWRDQQAHQGHRQAGHTTQLHEKLNPLRVGPYDERTHTSLPAAPAAPTAGGSVLVVTHIDVIPKGLEQVREILKTVVDASRKDAGNVRFDILQGVRQNHFTVVEAWRDARAREAHLATAHARTFRGDLYQHAVDGAPYDERLYRVVP